MPDNAMRAAVAVLLATTSLMGCVSYEPAILVPALNLSAEDIQLAATRDTGAARIDFGLELGLNESDSLSNIEILPGVRVRGVSAGGAADAAGIQLGDIILYINGTETNDPDVVTALTELETSADNYLFTVRRNTVVFEATVIPRTIGGNPAPRELYRVDPIASRAAYRTVLLSIRGEAPMAAARVIDILANSPLVAAGIAANDVILAVDNVALKSAQDLISRLNLEYELGDTVSLSIYDGQSVLEKQLRLWDPGRRVSELSLGPLLRYQSSLAPDSNSLSILDFWLFSLYSYNRVEEERTHSILGLINFGSDLGELVEED